MAASSSCATPTTSSSVSSTRRMPRRFLADTARAAVVVRADTAWEKTRPVRLAARGAPEWGERGEGKPEDAHLSTRLHAHLWTLAARWLSAETKVAAGPRAGTAGDDRRRIATTTAHTDKRTGPMAPPGGGRVLRLPRGADQLPLPECVPMSRDPPLAARAPPARPEGPDHVGQHRLARGSVAPQAAHHPPLAHSNKPSDTPRWEPYAGKPHAWFFCAGARSDARPYRDRSWRRL